jgi:hypothetical protein
MRKISDLIPSVTVPEGESGPWQVRRFTVTDEGARWHNIRCMISGGAGAGRGIIPGKYTRLDRNGEVIMSDTPAEKRDHYTAVSMAEGEVLINGLGIGMVLNACARKPEVTKVTVVEASADVIALCASHYRRKYKRRVEIIHDDALAFTPPKGVTYGMVWHDIWDSISEDNLPQMKTLHRRYGKRAIWQGSWARELIKYCR